MKTKLIYTLALLTFIFSACEDYLEPYPNGDRSDEDIWVYPEMAQGLIGQAYDFIPRNYNDNDGAFLDCATDNAVSTSTTRNIRNISVGAWTTSNDPFDNYWERNYRGIASINRFLEDDKGFNTRYMVEPLLDSLLRTRLQGEAFGLRAWFYWDLLQKFGGKGENGQLLGVPVVTEVFPNITDNIKLERNTYDETVEQILKDLDEAYNYLPLAHRDFLTKPEHQTILGSRCYGRVSGIITRAIKANVYLTWASPTFNPNNDMARWDNAAKYAKEVMDFKLNVDNVNKGFDPQKPVNWVHPEYPSFIWASRYSTNNDAMERMFYPGGFQGDGQMGPSQELIDAFPMANGYPIDDPRSGYDPQNPYANRDPRFYSTIFYNGAEARRNNTGSIMYTFETYDGGKDMAYAAPDNTLTNYYIKKFVYMGLNWSDNSIDRQRHCKALIRWAHMVLAFAEAANEVEGPNGNKYGLSAKDALAMLRSRDTENGDGGIADDQYLEEMAADKDSFRELIRNERRIITAFEGMRFYDQRRWGLNLNTPVHGAKITRNGDDSYSFDKQLIETRAYPSPFVPIPFEEVLRMPDLVQNEGWASWK